MRALVKRAGNPYLEIAHISEVTEITGDNHSANMLRLYNGKDGTIILWVNDCAILEEMPFNFYIDGTSVIAGDVVFTSFGRVGDDYDATDISDKQIERVQNAMYYENLVLEELRQ